MLCARECPDWCIYIDSHKEELPPKREGGRKRKRNVLDRFAIDYALCMYCGICVDVCPYDALFWSREFEYAEYDIRELTHEKERLSDWMATVLPPPPLEQGALLPGGPEAAPPAKTSAETAPAAPAKTSAEPAPAAPKAPSPPAEEKVEPKTPAPTGAGADMTNLQRERLEAMPGPNVDVPHEAPQPVALERLEDPEEVYRSVLEEQRAKGSSPQVAEARAKVARVKAERGIRRAGTPTERPTPQPPQGPVAPDGEG
jgi:NADH-quinone oxidoreductase subunit I